MQFINATNYSASYFPCTDAKADEHLLVVIKATFDFPDDGTDPRLSKEQCPIFDADVFEDIPGQSPIRYEADTAMMKPKCEVLINGSAYVPSECTSDIISVSIEFGSMKKQADILIKAQTNNKIPFSCFGVVNRATEPRVKYAGTFDEHWRQTVAPFLPDDFDTRYYQAAPEDQQIDSIAGGEKVVLKNLTPEGQTSFRLPNMKVPVEFDWVDGTREEINARLDTVFLEPDERRFMMIWRAHTKIEGNVFDLNTAIVGRMTKGWYRARQAGKRHIKMSDIGRHD